VQPLAIIEPFDIVEHRASRGRMTGKDGHWQFGLQGGEEALHRRVVPAVAFATHAAAHVCLCQERLIVGTCVLAASVAMLKQASWCLAALQRMFERGKHQATFECWLHRPAHHPARKQVKHDCQVQPALPCRQISDIGDPHAIWRIDLKRA